MFKRQKKIKERRNYKKEEGKEKRKGEEQDKNNEWKERRKKRNRKNAIELKAIKLTSKTYVYKSSLLSTPPRVIPE